MTRVLAFASLLLLMGIARLSAFQQPTEIARINDQPIWSDEFLYAFQKNRPPATPVNTDSLLNYLERFINFKLKVLAARQQGTDTLASFRQEYEGYISQVTKPYLDNPNKLDDLVAEAYERSLSEVRASHILIRTPRNPSPKDTLEAYQKIDSIRNLALQGTDFETLARYNSNDGNADKGGDLGWFTAFSMVYPFESATYNTPAGQVSEIVKTQFGYHIIKVTDKRQARGRVRTSHIFIARNSHTTSDGQRLIQKAYDSLKNGGKWNDLVLAYSEDTRSRSKNGALPMAGLGQLPEEYLEYAYKIKDEGTYTDPVVTPYGWHIIRLDARQGSPAFDKVQSQLAESVRRSGRLQYGEQEVLKKLKSKNDFSINDQLVGGLLDSLKKYLGQTEKLANYNPKRLFQIGQRPVYGRDFFSFLKKDLTVRNTRDFTSAYRQFEKKEVFSYEDSLALINYPEYRLLLQEYEEGLLLFDIMEKEIWNKALADSAGTASYFAAHRDLYPAPERAVTFVITSATQKSGALLQKVEDLLKNAPPRTDADSLLKAKLPLADYSLLKIAKRTLTQNDLSIFASGKFTENQLVLSESKDRLYLVQRLIPAGLYELDEIKGKVTADYQDFLDEQWVKSLRKENTVKIFKERIASLLPLD